MKDVKSYIANAIKESLNTCDKEKLDYYFDIDNFDLRDYFSANIHNGCLYDTTDVFDESNMICDADELDSIIDFDLHDILVDVLSEYVERELANCKDRLEDAPSDELSTPEGELPRLNGFEPDFYDALEHSDYYDDDARLYHLSYDGLTCDYTITQLAAWLGYKYVYFDKETTTMYYWKKRRQYVAVPLDEGGYGVLRHKDLTDGYLHDCYGSYGQKYDECGDYALGESNEFEENLVDAVKEVFHLEEFAFYDCDDIENITEYKTEDGDTDLSEEKKSIIINFMKEWIKENEHYVEALYYTYWDGSNFKSIVFDCEGSNEWCDYSVIRGEDDLDDDDIELLDEINEAAENHDYYCYSGFNTSDRQGRFVVSSSLYSTDPWVCRVEIKNEDED